MEIELSGETDEAVRRAVRLAVDAAGLGHDEPTNSDGAWWRAGLLEALDRGVEVPRRYEATPPPRRTRGATRA